MSDEKSKNFGKPWSIDGRFGTFEDAEARRNALKPNKNVECKIHKHATVFVVKTRLLEEKPVDSVVADEPQAEVTKVRAPKQKRGQSK